MIGVLGVLCVFFFQAEDGIRDLVRSRGLGDVYKRQLHKDAVRQRTKVIDGANDQQHRRGAMDDAHRLDPAHRIDHKDGPGLQRKHLRQSGDGENSETRQQDDVLDALNQIETRIRMLGVACLLYTSDAADERSSVDLGGRRIIKKTNKKKKNR